MNKILLASVVILLSACDAPAPTVVIEPAAPAGPSQFVAVRATALSAPRPSTSVVQTFVGKVWKVSASSAIEVGSTYAFLPDGEFVSDSPNGKPTRGKWTYEKGVLTMIEEGLPYRVEIVKLDASIFQIRIHDPSGAVDIKLVPAPEVPLPTTK